MGQTHDKAFKQEVVHLVQTGGQPNIDDRVSQKSGKG